MVNKLIMSLITSLVATTVFATPTPAVATLGSSKAVKGGTFYKTLLSEPQRLNPITSTDLVARYVQAYVMDNLMSRSPNTYKFEPNLALSVTLIDKGNGVEVKLRKGAKWHDGKPVTVKDVKFSYDCIMDKRYDTAPLRPYYENIESATIKDDSTVIFKFKKKYFGNYNVVAGLRVVPHHIYKDPKKKLNKIIVGSGPYKMDKYKKRRSIALKKNKDWWGWALPEMKHRYNPEKVMF